MIADDLSTLNNLWYKSFGKLSDAIASIIADNESSNEIDSLERSLSKLGHGMSLGKFGPTKFVR